MPGAHLSVIGLSLVRDLDGYVAADAAHDQAHFDVIGYVDGEEMALVGCALERRRCQSSRQPAEKNIAPLNPFRESLVVFISLSLESPEQHLFIFHFPYKQSVG